MLDKTTATEFFAKNAIKNFKPSEFACKCCGELKIDENLVINAQILRERSELPIEISSGYRCQKYNDTLRNSVKNSQHVKGLAFDIALGKYQSDEKYLLAETAFLMKVFNGIGMDDDFIHLDMKPGKKRLWFYTH